MLVLQPKKQVDSEPHLLAGLRIESPADFTRSPATLPYSHARKAACRVAQQLRTLGCFGSSADLAELREVNFRDTQRALFVERHRDLLTVDAVRDLVTRTAIFVHHDLFNDGTCTDQTGRDALVDLLENPGSDLNSFYAEFLERWNDLTTDSISFAAWAEQQLGGIDAKLQLVVRALSAHILARSGNLYPNFESESDYQAAIVGVPVEWEKHFRELLPSRNEYFDQSYSDDLRSRRLKDLRENRVITAKLNEDLRSDAVGEALGRGSYARVRRDFHNSARFVKYALGEEGDQSYKIPRTEHMLRREVEIAEEVEALRLDGFPRFVKYGVSEMGSEFAVFDGVHGSLPLSSDAFVQRSTQQQLLTLADLAEKLDRMHAKDWTHTDIKPWNLCFGPEGDGLFIDLANACKVGRRTSCTTKEFFPGTSDEITFFTAHPKYDVFAFGKTLASIFCNTEHSALKHNHLDSRDYIDRGLKVW